MSYILIPKKMLFKIVEGEGDFVILCVKLIDGSLNLEKCPVRFSIILQHMSRI